MNSRRLFIGHAVAGGTAWAFGVAIAAGPMLSEADPQARALGYVAETSRVDNKKFPRHASSQDCGNCALYQGRAGDGAAACALFAGKQVARRGWCSAWAKKA